MKKEERIQLLIDTFPEVYDALVSHAESEGYLGVSKYVRGVFGQIIDFFDAS